MRSLLQTRQRRLLSVTHSSGRQMRRSGVSSLVSHTSRNLNSTAANCVTHDGLVTRSRGEGEEIVVRQGAGGEKMSV